MPSVAEYKPGVFKATLNLAKDPVTGKRPRHIIYVPAKNEKEAKALAVIEEKKLREGSRVEPSKLTFGEYLDLWLKNFQGEESTRTWYEVQIRLHLKPTLGHIKLQKLTPADLRNLYDRKAKDGLGDESVHAIHRTASAALGRAFEDELIDRDLSRIVKAPKREPKERPTVTPEQLESFLSAASESRFYTFFLAALLTGTRRGELLGLKWESVDLGNGVITIERQVRKDKTKNKMTRQIAIGDGLVFALKGHRDLQDFEKTVCKYEDQGMVFAQDNGRPWHGDNLNNRDYKAVLKAAGLPANMHLHDLRHTFGTLLADGNFNTPIIQQMMGHHDPNFTAKAYIQKVPHGQRLAADYLDKLVFSRQPRTQAE